MFGRGKEIYGMDYGTFQQFVINCVRFALRGTPGYTPGSVIQVDSIDKGRHQQYAPLSGGPLTKELLSNQKRTRINLTQDKVDMIRTLAIQKRPRALIASAVGCSESTVSRVLAGKMNRKCK